MLQPQGFHVYWNPKCCVVALIKGANTSHSFCFFLLRDGVMYEMIECKTPSRCSSLTLRVFERLWTQLVLTWEGGGLLFLFIVFIFLIDPMPQRSSARSGAGVCCWVSTSQNTQHNKCKVKHRGIREENNCRMRTICSPMFCGFIMAEKFAFFSMAQSQYWKCGFLATEEKSDTWNMCLYLNNCAQFLFISFSLHSSSISGLQGHADQFKRAFEDKCRPGVINQVKL